MSLIIKDKILDRSSGEQCFPSKRKLFIADEPLFLIIKPNLELGFDKSPTLTSLKYPAETIFLARYLAKQEENLSDLSVTPELIK